MRTFVIYVLLILLLPEAWLLAPGQSCAATSSLDQIPKHLPYIVSPLSQYRVPKPRAGVFGYPVSLLNIDNDPELEIIRSKPNYIICEDYSAQGYATHWQQNFSAEFHSTDPTRSAFYISDALDLGTGKTMVVASGSTADYTNTRFWIMEAATGNIENEFDLGASTDLNNDGRWDGRYCVLGALDVPTEAGLRKALIITCTAGFDHEGRGVYAVDPWSGETLWSFQPGAKLTPKICRILDLDGDGTQEILLSSLSPCNLGGRKVNGFSDQNPFLFALGADGNLLWSQKLSEEPCSPSLDIGDIDGDGSLEIVLALHAIYGKKGSLSVWNGQGELQSELQTEYNLINCHLIPADQAGHLDIISGNQANTIARFRYDNQQLTIQQEATNKSGLAILAAIELPGRPGKKGIITQDRLGRGRILDWKFNIVGSYQDDEIILTRRTVVGKREGDPAFLLVGSNLGSFSLEPNPLAMVGFFARHFNHPRILVLSGLGLGLIIAGLIWWINRRTREESSATTLLPTNDPLHLKERRLHLLEDLEVSGHGAMAPLRSLRRLLWLLDAVQSGVGVNPNLVARMKEIWQDCHEDALPRLINILERARQAQISDTVVDESLASIGRIDSALVQLNHENFSADAVSRLLAGLHKEEKSSEALLQSLRRQVSELFCTSLTEVLDKVLRANQKSLDACQVKTQAGMVMAMEAGAATQAQAEESPQCRMDADELGFILDNLVGNACLAMASAPRRQLNIAWQPVNGVVKIDISDTGIGIATEDHSRVMEPGFSSRPGGGLGLAKSQRLLRKYDGHLHIKRSRPGQGTTFSLVVPRA